MYNVSSNTHIFNTGNSERMRIDAGGSVLIGKSTPTDLHNTWNHLIIGEKGAIISENGGGGIDVDAFCEDFDVRLTNSKRGRNAYVNDIDYRASQDLRVVESFEKVSIKIYGEFIPSCV